MSSPVEDYFSYHPVSSQLPLRKIQTLPANAPTSSTPVSPHRHFYVTLEKLHANSLHPHVEEAEASDLEAHWVQPFEKDEFTTHAGQFYNGRVYRGRTRRYGRSHHSYNSEKYYEPQCTALERRLHVGSWIAMVVLFVLAIYFISREL